MGLLDKAKHEIEDKKDDMKKMEEDMERKRRQEQQAQMDKP